MGSNPTSNLAEKPREMGTKLGCKAAITLNSKVLLRRSGKHRKEKSLYRRILKTWGYFREKCPAGAATEMRYPWEKGNTPVKKMVCGGF